MWQAIYFHRFGQVRGRVARRYCGDDDPRAFFSSTFPSWKELYLERQYIERAWESPVQRALCLSIPQAHAGAIRGIVVLASSHRILTGSRDQLVRVWDAFSGACLLALQGPATCVNVEAGETGCVARVGYKNGTVQIFDVEKEHISHQYRFGESMRGCTFSSGRYCSNWVVA